MRKILVATDFSEPSREVARRAALLAAAHRVELTVLHVFDPSGIAPAAALAEELNAIELLLAGMCDQLGRTGARVHKLLVEGFPDDLIPISARAVGADLLVVGSHGRTGVRRALAGSVAERVARASEIPVLVARGPATPGFERILCATDFSEHADHALDAALDLAAPGAVVDLVHFVQIPVLVSVGEVWSIRSTVEVDRTAEAMRHGAKIVADRGRAGVELRFDCASRPPRDGILDRLVAGHHDLVALGSHGRRGLRRAILGSVSEAVVRSAPCSVLVSR